MGWQREPGQYDVQLARVLHERWSTRIFDPSHELSDAKLRLLLEAARWAPSAGNSQPWAYLVARRGDDAHGKIVQALSRGNSWWAPRASAIWIGLAQISSGPGEDAPYSDYAVYDVGQAAAHVTIQAAELGLGVHQFAGFDHDRIAETFEVPDHFQVLAGLAIGRAASVESILDEEPGIAEREQLSRTRKPLVEFAFGATFGERLHLSGE